MNNNPINNNTFNILFSSKEDLINDINSISSNVIVVGEEPAFFKEKMEWINSESIFPSSFNFKTILLNQSNQKNNTLSMIDHYFSKINLPDRLINLINFCTDEFITNAFFDAPCDDKGTVLFKNIPRHENVVLPKPVQVCVGFNETEVAVSVKDFYGSINPNSLIKHLKKTLIKQEFQEPSSGTGAGIGLSLCVKKNISIVIKLDPKNSSEFVVFIPRVDNYKTYLEKSQFLFLKIK